MHGTVTRREIPESLKIDRFKRGWSGMKITAAIVSMVSTLFLGLLMLKIYPVFSQRVATTVQERPWASLGIGGVLLVGVPVLIGIFAMTFVGVPIGLILAAMYFVTLYLGRVFVILWLGQTIYRSSSSRPSLSWVFTTGLVVYSVLSVLPLMGKLVTFATMVAGVGALLIAKKELVMTLREQQVV